MGGAKFHVVLDGVTEVDGVHSSFSNPTNSPLRIMAVPVLR
jgi:hypothetical protein